MTYFKCTSRQCMCISFLLIIMFHFLNCAQTYSAFSGQTNSAPVAVLPVSQSCHTDTATLPLSQACHANTATRSVSQACHADTATRPVSQACHAHTATRPVSQACHADTATLPPVNRTTLQLTNSSPQPCTSSTPDNSLSIHQRPSLDGKKYLVSSTEFIPFGLHKHRDNKYSRASSIDESLVHCVVENETLRRTQQQLQMQHNNDKSFENETLRLTQQQILIQQNNDKSFENVIHLRNLGLAEYSRLHSSLPNLATNSSVAAHQSREQRQFTSVSDFISKMSENTSASGRQDEEKNINMISMHYFNSIKDKCVVNDVNKFILDNINGRLSEASEDRPNDSPKSNVSSSSFVVNSNYSRAELTPADDLAEGRTLLGCAADCTPSSSVLSVRKKPARALTGRHVRSGTGASIATLASLREKIKERSCLAALSTPTSSKPTGRGRGRRKPVHNQTKQAIR